MEDTIVGVATAAGEGGVAIVRVSGPEAVRLFDTGKTGKVVIDF